jgi:predicted glycoside hydrolase/deacetylase ChbG (UPF0249 family)
MSSPITMHRCPDCCEVFMSEPAFIAHMVTHRDPVFSAKRAEYQTIAARNVARHRAAKTREDQR